MAATGAALTHCVAYFVYSRFGIMLRMARLEVAGAAALLLLPVGQASGLLLQTGFCDLHFVFFTTGLKNKEALISPLNPNFIEILKVLLQGSRQRLRPLNARSFLQKRCCARRHRGQPALNGFLALWVNGPAAI